MFSPEMIIQVEELRIVQKEENVETSCQSFAQVELKPNLWTKIKQRVSKPIKRNFVYKVAMGDGTTLVLKSNCSSEFHHKYL